MLASHHKEHNILMAKYYPQTVSDPSGLLSERLLNRISSASTLLARDIAQASARREEELYIELRSRRENAARQAVVNRARAVMSSYGLTLPVYLKKGVVGAWTDFNQIQIAYPDIADVDSDSNGRISTEEAAELLALIYHEVGHIRWTTPILDLVSLAEVEDTLSPTHNNIVDTKVASESTFMTAWNTLEDQRMELAQVRDSAVQAAYFTILVKNHIVPAVKQSHAAELSPFVLTVGRTYLPNAVRDAARDRALKHATMVAGAAEAQAWVRDVTNTVFNYIEATNAIDMLRFTSDLHELLKQAGVILDIANPAPWGPETDDDSLGQWAEKVQASAGSIPEDGAPSEGEASDTGTEVGSGNGSWVASSPVDKHESERELNEALHEAATEALSLEITQLSLKDFVDDMLDQATVSPLDQSFGGQTLMPESVQKAELLVEHLMDAFRPYVADNSPLWQSQQGHGVLDVRAYRTRQSGDRNFYRRWDGRDDAGVDVTVTLVLDTSASMSSSLEALGTASYAIGMTCERLNIPFTSIIFGGSARQFACTGNLYPSQPECLGGTYPNQAMEWAGQMEIETNHHLVVFMTDGEFSLGNRKLPSYLPEGTHLLAFGYAASQPTEARRYAASLRVEHGASDAQALDDLMDLPAKVTDFILTTL